MMSAFGVEDNRLSKADDRRKGLRTATAGGAGVGVGMAVGNQVPKFRRAAQYRGAVKRLSEAAKEYAKEDPIFSAYNESQARRSAATAKRLVRVGSKRAVIGAAIGGTLGAGAGYQQYKLRHRNRS